MTCAQQTQQQGFINYFATHGRGTDDFVKNELLRLNINNAEVVRIKNHVEGKINFESILSPNEVKTKLKLIERLFLCILFKKFDSELDKCAEKTVENLLDLISFSEFDSHYSLIKAQDTDEDESEQVIKKPRLSPIKYRINCKLTGRWRQKRSNNKNVMEMLQDKFEKENPNSKNYEIDNQNPDFELILHVTNNCIACGIQLNKGSLATRSYIKHVGLRSTICAIMLQLAELDLHSNHSKIICDPFCGKGTIIMEYLGSIRECENKKFYILMSDVSDEQLHLCEENLKYLNYESNNIDLLKYCLKPDSCLPYLDDSIDVIITDLPFGKKHSYDSFIKNSESPSKYFYLKILNEFKRIVVKIKGILVILVNKYDMDIFEECITKSNEIENNYEKFKVSEKHSLALGETNAIVYKLVKDV